MHELNTVVTTHWPSVLHSPLPASSSLVLSKVNDTNRPDASSYFIQSPFKKKNSFELIKKFKGMIHVAML